MSNQHLKASELIKLLEQSIAAHGDGIVVYNDDGFLYSVGGIKFKTTEEFDGQMKWTMLLPSIESVEY